MSGRERVSGSNAKARKALRGGHDRRAAIVPTPDDRAIETPTPERMAKGAGVERVNVGRIDSAMGNVAALRVRSVWWPDTLYRRGRLSKLQWCAAVRLVEVWERAGFDRVGGQAWDMPVDGSALSGDGGGLMAAAARTLCLRARRVLLPQEWAVVAIVVIQGRTIETAAEIPMLMDLVNSRRARTRVDTAGQLLASALERLADLLGVKGA